LQEVDIAVAIRIPEISSIGFFDGDSAILGRLTGRSGWLTSLSSRR